MTKEGRKILVNLEKCAGCLNCQIHCSFTYTGAFNPAAARIQVLRGKTTRAITFTEECNLCGICARHCVYGGITLAEGGQE